MAAGQTRKKAAEPRRRDAAATRAAILVSARRAFVRLGYDGAGVREIASGAGVTAMMVNRYFGSKEELFAQVVADTMAGSGSMMADIVRNGADGERLASGLIAKTDVGAAPMDGFLIMLRSAASERAAEIGREQIEAHYLRQLTAALDGEEAAARAALMLSLIAGVQVMRQMIALTPLSRGRPAAVAKLLAAMFDGLIEPPKGRRSAR